MSGRPKLTLVKSMQAITWVSELLSITKENSIYALSNHFDDSISKHFYQYAKGTSAPSKATIDLADKKFEMNASTYPCASKVFNIGPRNGKGDYDPLWDALEGSIEKTWAVLVQFDQSIEMMRHVGVPHAMKIARVTKHLELGYELPLTIWREEGPNRIAKAYDENRFKPDMRLLVAVIAMWRLSTFMGEHQYFMSYILIGLMDKAIPNLLKKYGIIAQFTQHLIDLDTQSFVEYTALITNVPKNDPVNKELFVQIDKLIRGRRLCEVLKPVPLETISRKKASPR